MSKMSNGERWQDWMDKAIACPFEIPFETKIVIEDREWICKDRGGAIYYDGYAYWVDQLTESPEYSFGEIVEAKMILP